MSVGEREERHVQEQPREVRGSDHAAVHSVVNEWWGRDVQGLAQRFLFDHFGDTSFVLEEGEELVGFLIGFVSQSRPGDARRLYETFFAAVSRRGVSQVSAITAPENAASVRFHRSLGFKVAPGEARVNGAAVQRDHGGRGRDRVLFVRELPGA